MFGSLLVFIGQIIGKNNGLVVIDDDINVLHLPLWEVLSL